MCQGAGVLSCPSAAQPANHAVVRLRDTFAASPCAARIFAAFLRGGRGISLAQAETEFTAQQIGLHGAFLTFGKRGISRGRGQRESQREGYRKN